MFNDTVPWVDLQCVSVVFPDHTIILLYTYLDFKQLLLFILHAILIKLVLISCICLFFV